MTFPTIYSPGAYGAYLFFSSVWDVYKTPLLSYLRPHRLYSFHSCTMVLLSLAIFTLLISATFASPLPLPTSKVLSGVTTLTAKYATASRWAPSEVSSYS